MNAGSSYLSTIKLDKLFLIHLVFLPSIVSFALTSIASNTQSSLSSPKLSVSFKQRTKTTTQLQSIKSSKSIPIVACSSTVELQRAISFYLKPNDVVLELGSQLNDVSSLICDKIGVASNEQSNDPNDRTDRTDDRGGK